MPEKCEMEDKFLLAIEQMEKRMLESMKNMIKEEIRQLETHLTETNNLRFGGLEKDVDRLYKQSAEHYKAADDLEEKITRSRESITKEMQEKGRFSFGSVMSVISTLIAAGALLAVVIAVG